MSRWICLLNSSSCSSKWRLRCRILLHWWSTNYKPNRRASRRSLPERIFLPSWFWVSNPLLSRIRMSHEWNLSTDCRFEMYCGLLLPSRCQKHHTCFNEHGLWSYLPSWPLLFSRYLESSTMLTWHVSCRARRSSSN